MVTGLAELAKFLVDRAERKADIHFLVAFGTEASFFTLVLFSAFVLVGEGRIQDARLERVFTDLGMLSCGTLDDSDRSAADASEDLGLKSSLSTRSVVSS